MKRVRATTVARLDDRVYTPIVVVLAMPAGAGAPA
jgi:hypothetical protein